jgi:hypothetical protein
MGWINIILLLLLLNDIWKTIDGRIGSEEGGGREDRSN